MVNKLSVRLDVGDLDRSCPINLRTGNPGLCYATFRECPYFIKLRRDAEKCPQVIKLRAYSLKQLLRT